MKYSKAKSGPFARRLFIPAQLMEEMTAAALTTVGLMPSEPKAIRIDRFIEERFHISEQYEDMPDDYLGAAQFDRHGLWRIFVSRTLNEQRDKASKRRTRSTLGHEAGHGLCHEELWIEKILERENQMVLWPEARPYEGIADNGFMCNSLAINDEQQIDQDEDEPTKVKSPWWEIQANMAMASLLLPWHLVTHAAESDKRRVLRGSTPGEREFLRITASVQLADLFDVNPIMIRYRLQKWWGDGAQEFGF